MKINFITICIGFLGLVLLLGGCALPKSSFRNNMTWTPIPASGLIDANVRVEPECKFTPEYHQLWKSWMNPDENIVNYQQASCEAIMADMAGSHVFRNIVPPGDPNYDLSIKLISMNARELEKINLTVMDPQKQNVIAKYEGSAALSSSAYTVWNAAVRGILANIRYQMVGDYQAGKLVTTNLAGKERAQAPARTAAIAPADEKADAAAYQQAKSQNTLQAYTEFLHAHPSSPSRRKALQSMCGIIKTQGGSYERYRKFVAEYEDGLEFVPSRHRLALTGPEGMRIHDIITLLKRGIDDTVIAAKIRSHNARYKDFDFDEIASLKKMGITDPLVAAMIDSTTRAKHDQEELQKKKEMENLLAEIQRAQRKLDSMKAAQEQQQPQASVQGQQANGPSVGETVKNCASQITALEACKQLPWPANSVCAATAKSQFPCQ
jgi:hypothetical protein